MNRFTQQKPISKSVLSILVPVDVLLELFAACCSCLFLSSSCLFYLSYYKTRRNRELKTGCHPQYHLLLCSGRNLSGKSFLSGEPLWNHL